MNNHTCHYRHDLCADPEDGGCHVTSHTCAMSKEWLSHLPGLLTIIPCLWQAFHFFTFMSVLLLSGHFSTIEDAMWACREPSR